MTAPRRRWSFSLRMLFVGLGLGLAVWLATHGYRWIAAYHRQHMQQIEKLERTAYLLDGSVNIESERGKGVFTDEELDAIKAEHDRLKSLPSLRRSR